MSPYIFSAVCCILAITQNGVYGNLLKPILEIDTEDPNDVIMIGSMAYFNCTNSINAHQFYLRREGVKDAIKEQPTPVFIIMNLNKSDIGLYTCQYRSNAALSESSDPVYLYASDIYHPPTIIAEPKSIVQPGQNVTIICSSPYPNITFTLFKANTVINENEANPYTYVIHNASKEHAGQYYCRYRKLQIKSDFSSPLTIIIKDLPKPLIAQDDYVDGKLKISCMAPQKEKRMWFQLFNESKDVIDEKKAVTESTVAFIVPYTGLSSKRYHCMYRIRMGSNFADSLISDEVVIRKDPSRATDYTLTNIVRLLLSAFVLLALAAIIVTFYKGFKKSKSSSPTPPAPRQKLAVESEYTKLIEMKTGEPLEKSLTPVPQNTDAVIEKVENEEEAQTFI